MKRDKGINKGYQCRMFTGEEMGGSGQLNLLNYIDREEEKRTKLLTK